MINKRLSELSCNKDEFDKSTLFHKKSLQESGYKTDAQTKGKNNKIKSRNIIWFNPPFSQNVKINISKSYRCMSNMLSFIKQHNLNISSLSQIAKNIHAISEIKKIVHLLAVFCLQS